LFSFFGFRSSVGWMCALRTASPNWEQFRPMELERSDSSICLK